MLVMQIPECPICFEVFNDTAHTPRLLGCGHTICQFCLERLVLSSDLPQGCIRCPECRALCKWRGIQETPKNYILLHALSPTSGRIGRSLPQACFFKLCHVPFLFSAPSILALWTGGMIEKKLLELVKLVGASFVLLVFVPLSTMHLCMSWWTACLGFVVFTFFSIGAVGIGLFLLFLWWTQNVIVGLLKFFRYLFKG